MKVLVTGSSGLIGSEAVRYFDRRRAQVHGIDNNMRADFSRPQRRALRIQKICPEQRSFDAATFTNIGHVRDVTSVVDETACSLAFCMTFGDLVSGRPRHTHLIYSQYHCTRCRKHFNADMSGYALSKGHYTYRVVSFGRATSSWRMACLIKSPVDTFGARRPRRSCVLWRRYGKHWPNVSQLGSVVRLPCQPPSGLSRQRPQQKIADLFEHRHLFVQHNLTPTQR